MKKAVRLLSSFCQLTVIQNKVSLCTVQREPIVYVIKHRRGDKNVRGRIPRQPGLNAGTVSKTYSVVNSEASCPYYSNVLKTSITSGKLSSYMSLQQ
jgi:hypothetical protein